jgi:hypothetical protein
VSPAVRRDLRAGAWLTLTLLTFAYQLEPFDVAAPARPLVAVAFVALAPGYGWARLLAPHDAWIRWATTLGIGLAASTLTAFALALLEAWAPLVGFVLLAAFGGVGVIAWLVAARRPAPAYRGAHAAPPLEPAAGPMVVEPPRQPTGGDREAVARR